MKRECGAGIFPQCRSCPRNCKRRILRHRPLGPRSREGDEAVTTREPGDLPSAVVTREDVGRGVQTFGFVGGLVGLMMGPLVRGDVPLTSHRGPGPCPSSVSYDRAAFCWRPPLSHLLLPSICRPRRRSRPVRLCRQWRCRPRYPASPPNGTRQAHDLQQQAGLRQRRPHQSRRYRTQPCRRRSTATLLPRAPPASD